MGDNEGTSGSVVSEGGAASTEKQVKDSTTSAAAVVGQATEQPLANGTASEEGGSPNGGHNQPPTKAAVIKRIEFLFSKENLTSDVTLQYQMNHECYVPVVAVLNHPKITELTNNAELILEAIKSTSIVAFDGTQTSVKPTYTIPRTTIILREIPSTTTSEVCFYFCTFYFLLSTFFFFFLKQICVCDIIDCTLLRLSVFLSLYL